MGKNPLRHALPIYNGTVLLSEIVERLRRGAKETCAREWDHP